MTGVQTCALPIFKLKWEGPYLVIKKLSDVVCRIQKSKGAKPRVVHVDRLKPYQGSPIERWDTTSRVHSVDEHSVAIEGVEDSHDPPDQVPDPQTITDDPTEGAQDSNGQCPMGEVSESPVQRRYPKRAHRLPLRYR